MPRVRPGYEGTYVEVPSEVMAAMRALAEANGRSLHAEVNSAFRRHLDTPPEIVLVEVPKVAREVVEATSSRPRRKQP